MFSPHCSGTPHVVSGGQRCNRKLMIHYRNFFLGFENRAIVYASRFLAILKSDFYLEHSRLSTIR